jgi:hypothetical protein
MAHEHIYAPPTPAGLVALALVCFAFFVVLNGYLPAGDPFVVLLGIYCVCAFIPQFIAGLLEMRNGVILGGNVFMFFSAFFMLATGLKFIFEAIFHGVGIPMSVVLDGWCWLALTVALIAWTPAYARGAAATFWMIVAVDVALVFIDAHMFLVGPATAGLSATFAAIGGWALFVAGWIGLYIGAALVNNTVAGKTILPVGGPLIKG